MYLVVGLGIAGMGVCEYLESCQIPFLYHDSRNIDMSLSYGTCVDIENPAFSFQGVSTVVVSRASMYSRRTLGH